jgi:hypothetical protein
MRHVLGGVLMIAVCLASPVAGATSYVRSTLDGAIDAGVPNQGWYSDTLSNIDANSNVITGTHGGPGETQVVPHTYRSFFTFDLSGVSGVVTSATLQVERGRVPLDTPTGTVELFDVSTDPLVLNDNAGIDLAVFGDLGSGISYGVFEVAAEEPCEFFCYDSTLESFSLGAAGLAAINASLGSYFSIGATLTSDDGVGTNHLFGQVSTAAVLDLVTIPEPSTAVLLSLGLLTALRPRRLPRPSTPDLAARKASGSR